MTKKRTAYPKELESFGEWIARPYKNSTFDFKENKLYSTESQAQLNTINKFQKIHPNYVFYSTTFRIYQIAKTLDAKISMQSLTMPHLKEK